MAIHSPPRGTPWPRLPLLRSLRLYSRPNKRGRGEEEGHEREEIEAELEGRKRFDMDPPEAPAVIPSNYDKRIVGCPGGEGEDEHDVVWFWLEKDKPRECPVCSQYFVLKVIGEGGPPDGHGDDDHH